MDVPAISNKLEEIQAELRSLGLWQQHPPAWIWQYRPHTQSGAAAFFTWLQFSYLPAKLAHRGLPFIVPDARPFLDDIPESDRLLQLLIELDALG